MLSAEDAERAESVADNVSEVSGGSPERVGSPRSSSSAISEKAVEGDELMESMEDDVVKSKMEESSSAYTKLDQPAEENQLTSDVENKTDTQDPATEDKKEPRRKRVRLKSARSTTKTRCRTQSEKRIVTVDEMLAQKYSELKILLSSDSSAWKSRSTESRKSFPYQEAHENSVKLSQQDSTKRVRRRTSSKVASVKNESESAAPSENLPPRRALRQRRATSASRNQQSTNVDQLVEGVNFPSAKSALVRHSASTTHAHKEAAFYDAISTQSHEQDKKPTAAKWHYRPVPSRPVADPDQRTAVNWLREKHREVKAADFLNLQRQRALRESMMAAEQRELAEKAQLKLLRLRSSQSKRQLTQPTLSAQPRQTRSQSNLTQQRASYQAWLVQYRDEVQERQDADEEEKQLRKAEAKVTVQVDDDLLNVYPESARFRMQKQRTRLRSAQLTKSDATQQPLQNFDDE